MLQYDVVLVNLDPAVGHEIKKTRPCVIISPDEMNRHIATLIVAPMTTKSHDYPTRIPLVFDNTPARIVLDQIRTIDRKRVVKKLGALGKEEIKNIRRIISEVLVEGD